MLEALLLRPNLDPHQPRCSAKKVDKNTCGAEIKETEKNKAFKILSAMNFCDFDERTLAKKLETAVRLLNVREMLSRSKLKVLLQIGQEFCARLWKTR